MRTSHRLLCIDFLRGLAVLGMIEAHSVNSFLAPTFRFGGSFVILSYINGWVAPTFLFIAGFLQGAWVRKNWDTSKPLIPKLRHLGVILLIGYGLQFPWDHAFDWAQVSVALGKVDVLHCIAVTLALLLLLTKASKKLVTYDLLVLMLALTVVISAPFVWGVSMSTNPLIGYLSPQHGALFPLFPWSGFILAGTLASYFLGSAGRWPAVFGGSPKTGPDRKVRSLSENAASAVGGNVLGEPPKTAGQRPALPRYFALVAFVTAAFGWLLRWLLADWLQTQTYATRYDAFCFRLSLVLLGCAVCSWFITSEKPNQLTRNINWCGSRSLSLYVWHLILLHSGLGLLPPLRSIFPKTQEPSTVFWLYLLTLMGTVALTWLWQKLVTIFFQRSARKSA